MKCLSKLVSCWVLTDRVVAPESPTRNMVAEDEVMKTFIVTDETPSGKKPGSQWRPSLCEISEDMAVAVVEKKKPKRVMNPGNRLKVETKPKARVQSYNYDQNPSPSYSHTPSPRRSPNHVLIPGFSPAGFFF